MGHRDLIAAHNGTVVVDSYEGEVNNKHKPVQDKYEPAHRSPGHAAGTVGALRAQGGNAGAGRHLPRGHRDTRNIRRQEHRPPAHHEDSCLHHHDRRHEERLSAACCTASATGPTRSSTKPWLTCWRFSRRSTPASSPSPTAPSPATAPAPAPCAGTSRIASSPAPTRWPWTRWSPP